MQKEKLKHIAKRITAFAAAAAMAATFTFPAEVGNGIFKGFGSAIVASAVDYDHEYDISAGKVTISADGTYRIYSNDPSTSVKNTITVAKNVSADITLENVNIDVSATYKACAFKIEDDSTGNVTIDLVGENTLKSGNECAGLQKNGSGESIGKLTIKSTSGTGKLTATGGMCGAGIGGGSEGSGSYITISGGDVTATGGSEGAGIGGGFNGSGSNIEISGGNVTASGGESGAGIGGGWYGTGSNITISGGDVTATGGYKGAGIGGGDEGGTGSNITISGGNVIATGGSEGAGIGGGSGGTGSYIEISGGTVTATSKSYGAGIGGGENGTGSDITISGGDVTATGGKSGAGIGGGSGGTGEKITISGGDVTAIGGEDGAGIGGGTGGTGSDITISGGDVTATGGMCGAGIGGGSGGTGEKITISGGNVTATGGSEGAGIGGGTTVYSITGSDSYGNASDITISGGTVTATGGDYGAGIGGGCEGSASDITISGGSVKVDAGTYGNDIGGGYSGNGEVIPTLDGTTAVYLLEIENPTGADIRINNVNYPKSHTYYDTKNSKFVTENKIYVYLPAKTKSDTNEVFVGNTITYCYYDTANSKWIDVNTVVTNTSFDVTASNVIVHYTTADGTELKSQTFTFNEVTVDMVDLMKSQDMQLVIYFVNYSTDGSDTVILTDAQMKAIEYVLNNDFGIAS